MCRTHCPLHPSKRWKAYTCRREPYCPIRRHRSMQIPLCLQSARCPPTCISGQGYRAHCALRQSTVFPSCSRGHRPAKCFDSNRLTAKKTSTEFPRQDTVLSCRAQKPASKPMPSKRLRTLFQEKRYTVRRNRERLCRLFRPTQTMRERLCFRSAF